MKKALAYIRVSTDRQDCSMEMQEHRIRLYCELSGLELVDTLKEFSVSAKVPLSKRSQGSKISALLGSGVEHIVALKLDRLFRDTIDALTNARKWDDSGVSLHLVDMGGQSLNTSTSMGRMMLTMLAGFAEFERNMISERTSQALQHKKESGAVYGTIPYGFQAVDGRLISDPKEMEAISTMRNLRQDGLSYREICGHLDASGVRTKKGASWKPQTVKTVLGYAEA